MLTPQEIQQMAERKYWEFLRSLVTGESVFPLRIRFGKPATTDDFETLVKEIRQLTAGNFGYTIEWQEKSTRKWGMQRLPEQVRFDTEQQFVEALGKEKRVERFRKNVELAKRKLPQLHNWMISHVRWIDEFSEEWPEMLEVCEYFIHNPRPGLYRRELPIPVHTKFIEENQQVIADLLNTLLPESARTPGNTFDERFGLKPCEPLIRFRALDVTILNRLQLSHSEMGLPLSLFRNLKASGLRVVITENEMNFHTLPCVANGLAVFGCGNAAELLRSVQWINDCKVLYWGDIDEHGFHILSRLRNSFPNIESLMMDDQTLSQFLNLAGKGESAFGSPANLVPTEHAAYEKVRQNNLRLEQEKIPPSYCTTNLCKCFSDPG